MKWIKRLFLVLLCAAAIASIIFYYVRPKPVSVNVKRVDRGTIEATAVNTRAGTVKACRRAQLSSAIGGQIAEWPVREGMNVKKGALLLSLWNQDLMAQLTLAQSEAQAASVRADAVCLQADIAARQMERYLSLSKVGATTEEKVDSLQTEEKTRKAECRAARVSVVVSQDRVRAARANLERTLLYAPFAGTIADLNGELGEFVTPSPIGVQTLPTVDLIDTSCFYVSAPIDEVDAPLIREGMPARITLDAFRNRIFEGEVKRIADFVLDLEKQARTVEIEVRFVDPEETVDLLPGYSADAEVIIEVKHDVIRVPSEAIVEGKFVFVYHAAKEKVVRKEITKGLSNWEFTEVLTGLTAGDLVVVTIDRPGLIDGALAKVDVIGDD